MERRAPEAEIAQAIERVLAAEREASCAIEAARRDAELLIENARAERRRLLERARQRAARVHTAAQARLERSLARLEHGGKTSDLDLATIDDLTRQAVARLAVRLTAADHEPR
jgi:cell division septum initiation protein DivIVA